MSYLVMECHPGYAILLDEEGRFLKAANLRYEIGQTVYNPVLMKKAPEKQWNIVRRISSGIAAIAACFLFVFGISYYPKLYPALLIHISDHQPGSADGSQPEGHGCKAYRDK